MADLESLLLFAKIVEANSFSEASRRLNIPVSTLSRRVAELEDRLGVRLLERSTRSLRLTELGSEIIEHAQRTADINDAVQNIVSDRNAEVSGSVRLAAPPSISESLLAPLVTAFQASYPQVRIQVFITDKINDHIDEGVDLTFRVGSFEFSSLVSHTLLTYRHQVLASPAYLENHRMPETPQDLLGHRLLAFSFWRPRSVWPFTNVTTGEKQIVTFQPFFAANDYAAIIPALLEGVGIGELPPLVRPDLIRDGRLVEVMSEWRFHGLDLSLVHFTGKALPRPARLFREFSVQTLGRIFPDLPL